jgi:membrane protein implicated in regulation of membrane protease activity
MKKTILFYSALLVTVAGSAQTTIQSQQTAAGAAQVQKQAGALKVQGSGNGSAAATMKADAAANAESKAKAELATKKEMIANKKEKVETTGNTIAEKSANREIGADVSAHSGTHINAGENLVQVNGNGSLNTGTSVSLNKVKDNTIEVKKEVATRMENNTNATVEKAAAVKSAVHTKVSGAVQQTGDAAAGTSTKVVTAVKAKPAPVKVRAHTNTAVGIKL